MDLRKATADYAGATRLYQQGNLHRARDVAERALLDLSSLPTSNSTLEGNVDDGDDDSVAVRPPSHSATPSNAPAHHQLYGNLLLLLASIYTAVREDAEAERLLATCEGYWREHLAHGGGGGCSDVNKKRGANHHHNNYRGSSVEKGEAADLTCYDVDEGLAAVAYNRAVLQLEQLHDTTPTAASDHHHQQQRHQHAMLPSVMHVSFALSSSPLCVRGSTENKEEQERQQQRQQEVATHILHTYLDSARDRLRHTLGAPRCLLADVYHSCGVCLYYMRDYIGALEAWQQSLAIRVHVHSCLTSRQESSANAKTGQVKKKSKAASAPANSVEELKVALTLEHIAQVYQLIDGKAAEALKMCDTVAVTRERFLGPLHPLYARTLFLKAVLASRLRRVELARALLEACDDICHRNGSECSPEFVEQVRQWKVYVGVSS